MKRMLWFLAVVLTFLTGLGCHHAGTVLPMNRPINVVSSGNKPASHPKPVVQSTSQPGAVARPDIKFASQKKLEEHFKKHGHEFKASSVEEYLQMAQALRDMPLSDNVIEFKREDGVATRFDRETGAFLAYNPDFTIRTFFHPNDGEAYFERQKNR